MEANGKINRDCTKLAVLASCPLKRAGLELSLQCTFFKIFSARQTVPFILPTSSTRLMTQITGVVHYHQTGLLYCRCYWKNFNGTTEQPHTAAQCSLGAALTTQHESKAWVIPTIYSGINQCLQVSITWLHNDDGCEWSSELNWRASEPQRSSELLASRRRLTQLPQFADVLCR